jgi:hypothetical protein
MEPLVGIYSAVTRADLHGKGAWTTDQTVDLESAIRGYTMGSAFANFVEAIIQAESNWRPDALSLKEPQA